MKCTKCGKDNPKNKNVCIKCGAFLYSSNPNNRVPLTKEQKRERRKMIFKGSAMGCLWSALIIIGMFIVLGVVSYLVVRFILPDDIFDDYVETTISDTLEPGSESNSATD